MEAAARSGFNLQWMLVEPGQRPRPTDERVLDVMAANGFDFLRVPTDYRADASKTRGTSTLRTA